MQDSAKVRSESIAAFETALGRFAAASLERVKAAETALRRTTGQLDERRTALRRDVARLRNEIENADEEEDTSHAQRQCEEAEQDLANVVRWQRNVEITAASYLREAAKLQDLDTAMTADARAVLRRVLENLGAYFALQHDGAAIGRAGVTPAADGGGPYVGGDPRRIRAVASVLLSLPALRREAWDIASSSNVRLEALQEAENRIADVTGRPALPVLPAALDAEEYGVCDGETIWINDEYLGPGSNREMIRTIVHEGRHAYQYYVCADAASYGNPAEVEAWRSNLSPGQYVEWKENPARYMSQPVEADAFACEDAVMEVYLNDGGD